MLNRVICWSPSRIQLEADPRLAAGVEPEARSISTPGTKDKKGSDEARSDDQVALSEDETRDFRSGVVRANYLALTDQT